MKSAEEIKNEYLNSLQEQGTDLNDLESKIKYLSKDLNEIKEVKELLSKELKSSFNHDLEVLLDAEYKIVSEEEKAKVNTSQDAQKKKPDFTGKIKQKFKPANQEKEVIVDKSLIDEFNEYENNCFQIMLQVRAERFKELNDFGKKLFKEISQRNNKSLSN